MKRQQRSRPRRNLESFQLISEIEVDARGLFLGTREHLAELIAVLRDPREKLVTSGQAHEYIESVWELVERVPSSYRLEAAKAVLTAVVQEAFGIKDEDSELERDI